MNDDDPLPMDLDHLADNHVIADLIYTPSKQLYVQLRIEGFRI